MVQDSASAGSSFAPPISISTSRSEVCSETSKLVLAVLRLASSASGLASVHTTSVSARAVPAASARAAAHAMIHRYDMALLPLSWQSFLQATDCSPDGAQRNPGAAADAVPGLRCAPSGLHKA